MNTDISQYRTYSTFTEPYNIKNYHAPRLECDLHSMFSYKRLNGEWFRLHEEDINFIKSFNSVIYGDAS
ncbi:MAG: GIY-YIG nuclease family protein [Aggregatilineales bacterium]